MAMTEVDLTDAALPSVSRFLLDASTANKATQCNLRTAETATRVTVRFESNDGKLAFETAADAIHANHVVVTKDSPTEFSIAHPGRSNRVVSFYVASATTSTYVSVIMEAGE